MYTGCRHQVWVTGCVVGGGGGDGFLCGLAAGRLLSRLVSGASAEQEEGEQEEGEQEEGEKEEDLQLLRSVFQAWVSSHSIPTQCIHCTLCIVHCALHVHVYVTRSGKRYPFAQLLNSR